VRGGIKSRSEIKSPRWAGLPVRRQGLRAQQRPPTHLHIAKPIGAVSAR
jgi:hypothetical protein